MTVRPFSRATAALLACGALASCMDLDDRPRPTCSELAKQYSELVDDATVCTVGDDATCAGRMPIWGMEVDASGRVSNYGLSSCPSPGSGIAVNPGRAGPLEAVLAAYQDLGCPLWAGPGCGAPGQETLVGVCVAGQDGAARCRKLAPP